MLHYYLQHCWINLTYICCMAESVCGGLLQIQVELFPDRPFIVLALPFHIQLLHFTTSRGELAKIKRCTARYLDIVYSTNSTAQLKNYIGKMTNHMTFFHNQITIMGRICEFLNHPIKPFQNVPRNDPRLQLPMGLRRPRFKPIQPRNFIRRQHLFPFFGGISRTGDLNPPLLAHFRYLCPR